MFYKIKEVDKKRCNSCEKCVKVCHVDCFDMIEDKSGKIVANFKDKEKCDSCGDCIILCSKEGAAIVLESVDKKKHGHVNGIKKEKCEACEKCLKLCPGKNIEMVEEKGKVFAKIIDPKKCLADGHCSFCCCVDDKIYS